MKPHGHFVRGQMRHSSQFYPPGCRIHCDDNVLCTIRGWRGETDDGVNVPIGERTSTLRCGYKVRRWWEASGLFLSCDVDSCVLQAVSAHSLPEQTYLEMLVHALSTGIQKVVVCLFQQRLTFSYRWYSPGWSPGVVLRPECATCIAP